MPKMYLWSRIKIFLYAPIFLLYKTKTHTKKQKHNSPIEGTFNQSNIMQT